MTRRWLPFPQLCGRERLLGTHANGVDFLVTLALQGSWRARGVPRPLSCLPALLNEGVRSLGELLPFRYCHYCDSHSPKLTVAAGALLCQPVSLCVLCKMRAPVVISTHLPEPLPLGTGGSCSIFTFPVAFAGGYCKSCYWLSSLGRGVPARPRPLGLTAFPALVSVLLLHNE